LKGKYTPPTANAGQCRSVTGFERQAGSFWDGNGTDATAAIASGVTNDEERPMPTGQELLRLAGLNDDADALPDFEEDVVIASHVSPTAQESEDCSFVSLHYIDADVIFMKLGSSERTLLSQPDNKRLTYNLDKTNHFWTPVCVSSLHVLHRLNFS
jgi:hypothetical protein